MSRRKGTGMIFRRPGSRYWWVAYSSGGKRRQESVKSEKKADAQALLTKRLGDTQRGIISSAKVGTITLADGLKAHVADLKMNGKQSADDTERRIEKHVVWHPADDDEPEGGYFLPGRLMATISTADVEAFKAHRINDDKAKPATVNRELAILRRAFRLAVRGGLLATMPYVGLLEENNTRTGFFERAEFDAILTHLPTDVRPVLEFLYATGWRKSEALNLTMANVDLDAGTVKLDVGTTKSRKGRTIILTPSLATLLKKQVASIDALKKKDVICPWIFHRTDGTRIKSLRGAWEAAREAAGFPKKILHDFRRTAVRNLDRAGVPRSTAMAMVGHETEAIYRRYSIQDEAMLREGAEKLAAWTDAQAAGAKAKGQLKSFGKRRRK
jgi:integrase